MNTVYLNKLITEEDEKNACKDFSQANGVGLSKTFLLAIKSRKFRLRGPNKKILLVLKTLALQYTCRQRMETHAGQADK